jgi:tRNA threonylcarbamoyladenosine biosynthesis protein TsaE
LPLYHIDLYRLGEQANLEVAMFDDYFYREGVCAIEWAELLERYLPDDRLIVQLRDEQERRIMTVKATGALSQSIYDRWLER